MKTNLAFAFFCLSFILSCKKEATIQESIEVPVTSQFVQYTIQQGQQYCDQNTFKPVEYTELRFVVKFDSSAIYTTKDPSNQYDINKLYGFSDNSAEHQQFSARFGWRWSDNALRLFSYIYNNGIRQSKELSSVAIGDEVNCSIKVVPGNYIFTLNNLVDSMPRKSTAVNAKGYRLYPYFGGDETAPHKISISIKELSNL